LTAPAAEGSRQARLAAAAARLVFGLRLGANPSIPRLRRVLGRTGLPVPREVSFVPGVVGGVGGEWVRAAGGGAAGRLLYLHGGGFVACSPRSYRPLTGALARRGFEVFAPDYRLAPEHPFPAAHEDAWAAWQAFAASGPAVLAGDSAGGHLALATLLRARDAGGPMPRAAALFSPFLDLALTGASMRANAARDGLLGEALLRRMARSYLGEAAAARAAPLAAELAGLPPLLVHVGEREVLRDDAVRLARAASAAGVTVALKVFPAVPHTWQIAVAFLPEARRSLNEAAAFLAGPPSAGLG
jgi:epsilon-lactone hydrolase